MWSMKESNGSPMSCPIRQLARASRWLMISFCCLAETPDWQKAYLPTNDRWRATEQQFSFNNGAEPESIDPALITGIPESRIVGALFEGLVDLDPKTLAPRPALAERWEISADGRTYRFFLRGNAQWSDGTPITAMDAYRSWQRVLTPETGAAYAYQLYAVKNAAAYHRGTIADFGAVGLEVEAPGILRVTLAAPCAYFLELAAFHTLFPVPVDVIAQHERRWVRPEHIRCSGAFTLEHWEPRQAMILVKNPFYWDRDVSKLETVTIFPYDELDTAYKRYANGEIHWLPDIPLGNFDEIKLRPDFYLMPYEGVYFYRFNVRRPPFDDARVRQAFSIAIDRRVITEQVLRGGQAPATGYCPPVAGYEPVAGNPYDKGLARRLLHEAGYGDGGKPFPAVELLYNTSESHRKIAEAVAQQWNRNLGVTVALRNAEWKIVLSEMDNLNYQIVRASWVGDYSDPNTFFDLWCTGCGNNRTGWSNARYDELLRQSQIERDRTKRYALFREMEQILVDEEFPIIPLYIYVKHGLLAESVHGWYDNSRDFHPLKYIWIEP